MFRTIRFERTNALRDGLSQRPDDGNIVEIDVLGIVEDDDLEPPRRPGVRIVRAIEVVIEPVAVGVVDPGAYFGGVDPVLARVLDGFLDR